MLQFIWRTGRKVDADRGLRNTALFIPRARYITQKSVAWWGPYLQLNAGATQLRRNSEAVGSLGYNSVTDLTCPGIQPQTSRTNGDVSNHYGKRPVAQKIILFYYNIIIAKIRVSSKTSFDIMSLIRLNFGFMKQDLDLKMN